MPSHRRLLVAVIAVALVSFGGVVFDLSGYRATFGMSATLLVVAAVLAMLAARAGSRSVPASLAVTRCEAAETG